MDKDVTIIVPVHNAELTIGKAVRSLVNKKNIYVILIENGSSDRSVQICKELENEFENVKCIISDKCSVSYARNIGIKNVKSEYIGFVDADDYTEDNMFYCLADRMDQSQADLAICEYYIEKGNIVSSTHQLDEIDMDPKSLFSAMVGNKDKDDIVVMGSVWRCLYKRAIINKYNLQFDETLKIGEDLIFNLNYLEKINQIEIVKKPLYHYQISNNSASLKIGYSTWSYYNAYMEKECYIVNKYNDENLNLRFCNQVRNMSSWIATEYLISSLNKTRVKKILTSIIKSRKKYFCDIEFESVNLVDHFLDREDYFILFIIGRIYKIRIKIKLLLNTIKNH